MAGQIAADGGASNGSPATSPSPSPRGTIQTATDCFGGLDILVNNAGSRLHGPVPRRRSRRPPSHGGQFLRPGRDDRLALPLLAKGNRPIVVNVGSILGHRGVPYNGVHAASKFAVRGSASRSARNG